MSLLQKAGPILVMGAVVGEEEETKQAKEMAAARKRWESLVLTSAFKRLIFSSVDEGRYALNLAWR